MLDQSTGLDAATTVQASPSLLAGIAGTSQQIDVSRDEDAAGVLSGANLEARTPLC